MVFEVADLVERHDHPHISDVPVHSQGYAVTHKLSTVKSVVMYINHQTSFTQFVRWLIDLIQTSVCIKSTKSMKGLLKSIKSMKSKKGSSNDNEGGVMLLLPNL